MKAWKTLVAAGTLSALTGAAQADLFDRGGGMIYDSTLDITWLADMNYARTSGADADGLMKWKAAQVWASNLVYGGYSDWRLPSAFNVGGGEPCFGARCSGSEMGHLFIVDLGNKPGESVLNQVGDKARQIANFALFSNLQSFDYWYGTELAANTSFAWNFLASYGVQDYDLKGKESYAVALRKGDVSAAVLPGSLAAAVPEPQTYAMLLLGFGAVLMATRWQR
jgi:PEP-CTERM motif